MSSHRAASPLTKDSSIGAPMITAIVLIKAEPKRIAEFATKLAGIDGVSQGYSVCGECDLVAMVEVTKYEPITRTVTNELTVLADINANINLATFRSH